MSGKGTKLWGGRFSRPTSSAVEEFTGSLAIDRRLWKSDLLGSIAHARMLGRQGILPAGDAARIIEALETIQLELGASLDRGEDPFDPAAEDIHSEVERKLREKVGSLAGKLHVARSRNDQVATATRHYLRGRIDELISGIHALQGWIVEASGSHLETLLPGLTHFQHAQPVSLAHHLMAYFWMFERDRARLQDCRKRVNQLPLGSAALAGTSFPIDREAVARELGFEGLCENSLDAVSDRDFVVELLSVASLLMAHLSRLSEELILWSSPELGFVELDDAVTTGSSIMPQKKNPDVAELIRGRSGRAFGALMGALTMLKGLPLSYNRDLQEDKEHLISGLDTAQGSVRLALLLLESASFRVERMAQASRGDFSTATELADDLVRHGLPFREAHECVGGIVRHCLEKGVGLESLGLRELQSFSPLFDESSRAVLEPAAALRAKTSRGGTAPAAVVDQIRRARELLASA